MYYFKNFIAVAVLVTTLFAGQALESAKIRIKDKEWGEAEKYLLELINGDCHTAVGVTADARPEKGLLQVRCSYHDGKKAKHIQEIGPIVEWKKVVHNTVVQLELQ